MRTGAMGTTVTDQLITSEFTQAVEQGRVKSVTYSAGDYTVSGTYFRRHRRLRGRRRLQRGLPIP